MRIKEDIEVLILKEEREKLTQEFRDIAVKILTSKGETKRYWVERRHEINDRVSEITIELGDAKNRSLNKV